jgi:Ribosomal protein L17
VWSDAIRTGSTATTTVSAASRPAHDDRVVRSGRAGGGVSPPGPGGYSRIVRIGPRPGVAAEMAFLELVDFSAEEQAEEKAELAAESEAAEEQEVPAEEPART